ncbi:hypothetical protein [Desnuesiella massiliensis]|uniref:hypothetical protein n=1 Tax=Desnuesiella massiliensis TaxID=1650662 RepID=UPI0006E2A80D|nr:hypothetical protein [Desnuesiella massiliensis]
MNVGEHRFKNVKYRDINKLFLENKLYVSAVYVLETKYMLEVLVPRDFARSFGEHYKGSIGERWERDIRGNSNAKDPLQNAKYHIEINGLKVHSCGTSFRYEPENFEEEVRSKIILEDMDEKVVDKDIPINELLEGIQEHMWEIQPSLGKEINNLFKNEELKNALASSLATLKSLELADANDSEKSREKYELEKERREKAFFHKFRESVILPEHLKNQPVIIMNLIFPPRAKYNSILNREIESLKFVYKDYTKYFLPRINLQLPFGRFNEVVKSDSEIWGEFTEKIFIEDIIECKKEHEPIMDSVKEGMPQGKKAVYITYETLDNALVIPLFYTKELLNSHDFSQVVFTTPLLLKDKSTKGFNKYIDFVGYIDENKDLVDFELFQLIVTFVCNEEISLI